MSFGPRWGMIGGGLISAVAAVALGVLIARRRGLAAADLFGRLVAALRPRRLGPQVGT